ncbi:MULTISPECIES: hypothetical protein [Streptomyces]|uniref:ATP synthase I n=1 Tax=Streptomyces qinglanensis TaxID=943816 RepID=A0A1E7K8R3_9ACTN|nr:MULTISPECIES: hypothetical protein [Streptomyces]MBE9500688.1 hypothetical protein [Streptomyces sp. GKU 257-1]OEV00311.1 ATP synthase I [Streptomyces qinglanensis]OEV25695.1 ATP synthase I [Streptomyces nanshensis]
MQSNDARMLLHCAVPTAVAAVVAAVISGVFAGSKGAIGGAAGALVAILFMGIGLYALQRTARSLPHLFQAMGLLLYTTQILLLLVVLIAFRDTTLFDTRSFALALLASTIVWVVAQTRAHMKAKILYVEPSSSSGEKASGT